MSTITDLTTTEVITIREIIIPQKEIEGIIVEWLGVENDDNEIDFDFDARGEVIITIKSKRVEKSQS